MTWFVVGAGCEDVLIGKPIENTVVVLVDAQYEPVPIGVPGEIVFGSCIARGYLHRDDLTAAKFVPNKLWGPAAPSDGAVAHSSSSDDAAVQSPGPAPTPTPKYLVDMKSDSKVPPSPLVYKTGDLAVRLGSGDLRFMGRVDRQVKVRGFRIELEAVEAGTPHELELYPATSRSAYCSAPAESALLTRSLPMSRPLTPDHSAQGVQATAQAARGRRRQGATRQRTRNTPGGTRSCCPDA